MWKRGFFRARRPRGFLWARLPRLASCTPFGGHWLLVSRSTHNMSEIDETGDLDCWLVFLGVCLGVVRFSSASQRWLQQFIQICSSTPRRSNCQVCDDSICEFQFAHVIHVGPPTRGRSSLGLDCCAFERHRCTGLKGGALIHVINA